MVLSESERLQRQLDSAAKYISRSKVRDSSELISIKQARAASVESPQQVQGSKEKDGNCCEFTAKGKGTNMEYLNILMKAQGCAICSDVDPVTNPGITIPCTTPVPLSTFYTAPCRIPGYQVFFPPKLADGKNCDYNRTWYPSG